MDRNLLGRLPCGCERSPRFLETVAGIEDRLPMEGAG
jgi:hypothetical protein